MSSELTHRQTEMIAFGVDKCTVEYGQKLAEKLFHIEALITDDAYACSFQTMGQYRTALLKELK